MDCAALRAAAAAETDEGSGNPGGAPIARDGFWCAGVGWRWAPVSLLLTIPVGGGSDEDPPGRKGLDMNGLAGGGGGGGKLIPCEDVVGGGRGEALAGDDDEEAAAAAAAAALACWNLLA